jgi:hypothetical protein
MGVIFYITQQSPHIVEVAGAVALDMVHFPPAGGFPLSFARLIISPNAYQE